MSTPGLAYLIKKSQNFVTNFFLNKLIFWLECTKYNTELSTKEKHIVPQTQNNIKKALLKFW